MPPKKRKSQSAKAAPESEIRGSDSDSGDDEVWYLVPLKDYKDHFAVEGNDEFDKLHPKIKQGGVSGRAVKASECGEWTSSYSPLTVNNANKVVQVLASLEGMKRGKKKGKKADQGSGEDDVKDDERGGCADAKKDTLNAISNLTRTDVNRNKLKNTRYFQFPGWVVGHGAPREPWNKSTLG